VVIEKTVIVPGGGVGRAEFGNEYNPKVPASSDIGLYGMIGSFGLTHRGAGFLERKTGFLPKEIV